MATRLFVLVRAVFRPKNCSVSRTIEAEKPVARLDLGSFALDEPSDLRSTTHDLRSGPSP
jgi:hypothetical protein